MRYEFKRKRKRKSRMRRIGKGFLPLFAVGALWLCAEAVKAYKEPVRQPETKTEAKRIVDYSHLWNTERTVENWVRNAPKSLGSTVIAEPNVYTIEDAVETEEVNEPNDLETRVILEPNEPEIDFVKGNLHYTVEKGDTLEEIAKKKGILYIRLKLGNRDIDIDNLRIGQVINTPRKQDLELQAERGIDYDSLYESFIGYEDLRTKVYPDTEGNPTIGIGFNLNKKWAKERIEELGYNYESVLGGNQEISENHARELIGEDAALAIIDAKNYIGKHWHRLHQDAKEIVIDMSYNMGEEFGGIWSLRACLNQENPDYAGAAKRMKTYKWYKDTGRRAEELTKKMEKLGRIYNLPDSDN